MSKVRTTCYRKQVRHTLFLKALCVAFARDTTFLQRDSGYLHIFFPLIFFFVSLTNFDASVTRVFIKLFSAAKTANSSIFSKLVLHVISIHNEYFSLFQLLHCLPGATSRVIPVQKIYLSLPSRVRDCKSLKAKTSEYLAPSIENVSLNIPCSFYCKCKCISRPGKLMQYLSLVMFCFTLSLKLVLIICTI